jgi:hypothetical protein
LTGTSFLVNTPKWSDMSSASLIYLASSKFKQTFVLDLSDGPDIMRDFAARRSANVTRDPR